MSAVRILLVCAALLVGCSGSAPSDGGDGTTTPAAATTPAAPAPASPPGRPTPSPGRLEPSPPFDRATVTLRAPDGEGIDYEVYVAVDPPARQRGLMERTALPARTGMVFLFPDDTTGGFWMLNTRIPLDIAFADADGAVVAVLTMEPCTQEPCEVYRPGAAYRTALEANAGELTGLGVGPGWRLELPAGLPTPAQEAGERQ